MSENIQKLLDTHWYDPKFEAIAFYGAPDNPLDPPKRWAVPGMFKPFSRIISISEDEYKTIGEQDFKQSHKVRIGAKGLYWDGTVRLVLMSTIGDYKYGPEKEKQYEIGLYFSV